MKAFFYLVLMGAGVGNSAAAVTGRSVLQRLCDGFFRRVVSAFTEKQENFYRAPTADLKAPSPPITDLQRFFIGDYVPLRNGGVKLISGVSDTTVRVETILGTSNLGPLGDRRQLAWRRLFPGIEISESPRGNWQGGRFFPDHYILRLPASADRDARTEAVRLFRALDMNDLSSAGMEPTP